MEISSTICSEDLNRKLIDFNIEVRAESCTTQLPLKVNCRLKENNCKDICQKIYNLVYRWKINYKTELLQKNYNYRSPEEVNC